MQDDLRQHLGLQKADAASVVACASGAGHLKSAHRPGKPTTTRTADRPPLGSTCKPTSTCMSEGMKAGGTEFQTMFRWASHIGIPENSNLDSPLGNSLRASPGAGVRYGEEEGRKPSRPMSAPARRRACMQASTRPQSASKARGTSMLSGAAMGDCKPRNHQQGPCSANQQAGAPQSRWQGKTAYRHESTAIRSKLAKQRNKPMSAI